MKDAFDTYFRVSWRLRSKNCDYERVLGLTSEDDYLGLKLPSRGFGLGAKTETFES